MKQPTITLLCGIFGACSFSLPSFAGDPVAPDQMEIFPVIFSDEPWQFTLSLPPWVSGIDGTVGVRGFTADTSASFADIVSKLDMVAAATVEARKGVWGGWIDAGYLKASVGSDTPGPLFSSVDVGIEQVVVEAAIYYRAWQGERGFVDLYTGARYLSVGGELNFNLSDSGVAQASQQLSQEIADQVAKSVKAQTDARLSSARNQVADNLSSAARSGLVSKISAEGGGAKTTIGNLRKLADSHPRMVEILRNSDRLQSAIRAVAEARIDEKLAEAKQTAAKASAGNAAALAAADQAKAKATKAASKAEKKLAAKIEDALRDAAPSQVSQTFDWVDPFVGMRARYDFTNRLYAVAKADVGGFGVGSDLAWQAYAALGYQLTESGNTTLELGYKYLDVDYTRGGFTYDIATGVGRSLTLALNSRLHHFRSFDAPCRSQGFRSLHNPSDMES